MENVDKKPSLEALSEWWSDVLTGYGILLSAHDIYDLLQHVHGPSRMDYDICCRHIGQLEREEKWRHELKVAVDRDDYSLQRERLLQSWNASKAYHEQQLRRINGEYRTQLTYCDSECDELKVLANRTAADAENGRLLNDARKSWLHGLENLNSLHSDRVRSEAQYHEAILHHYDELRNALDRMYQLGFVLPDMAVGHGDEGSNLSHFVATVERLIDKDE